MLKPNSVYIIAEAGVNHNGSEQLAMQLIDCAVSAKADAVKFQLFQAAQLVTRDAKKATYQISHDERTQSQYDMLKQLELPLSSFINLKHYSDEKEIDFLLTVFDELSFDFAVNTLKCSRLKIGSGELTNAPLLLKHAQVGLDVILSTGMSTMQDITQALAVLAYGYRFPNKTPTRSVLENVFKQSTPAELLSGKVALLHCTSQYPVPFESIHLNVIRTMNDHFGLMMGYSDHTLGIEISSAAVACGARIIEKHFTLDKTMSGPDHLASIEPGELTQLVTHIRHVELALGQYEKRVQRVEEDVRLCARKSLVAKQDIAAGERFTTENMTVKRPGDGVSPIYYWDYLGQQAQAACRKDRCIPKLNCVVENL